MTEFQQQHKANAMDKRLVIKGSDLVGILEDLSTNDLLWLLKDKFPCALRHHFDEFTNYYTIFPSENARVTCPSDLSEKNILVYLNPDILFGVAFNYDVETLLDLYYIIEVADKYLVNKGHRPKPGMKAHWNTKLRDAKYVMSIWKASQQHTKFQISSKEYKEWELKIYNGPITNKEKEYLCALLKYYTGKSNKELGEEYNIANVKRHKRKAIHTVVPKLRKEFPNLPLLPCEIGKEQAE